MSEPRFAVVEGRSVLVIERVPPIAPSLNLLLNGGRDAKQRLWPSLRVSLRNPLTITGSPSASCLSSSNASTKDDHNLRRWIEGFYTCSDNVVRYLSLQACTDCGAVCVRDRSFDTLEGLSHGRRPLRRRDEVLGWYSGARRNGRVYT